MLEENDRVIERQEEAVGEKNWQNLQCDQQVYAEDAHLLCLLGQLPCALWFPFTLLFKRGVVIEGVGEGRGEVGVGGEGEKLN